MNTFRRCAVPMCTSTTIKYPDKLFIHIPNNAQRRKQWLQLARRDPKFSFVKSTNFFCEDHFDLPNDMENYIKYSIMGCVSKIRMKPDCLPSRFECQSDKSKHSAPPRHIIQEIVFQEIEMPVTSGITSNSNFQLCTETNFQDKATQVCRNSASPSTTHRSGLTAIDNNVNVAIHQNPEMKPLTLRPSSSEAKVDKSNACCIEQQIELKKAHLEIKRLKGTITSRRKKINSLTETVRRQKIKLEQFCEVINHLNARLYDQTSPNRPSLEHKNEQKMI